MAQAHAGTASHGAVFFAHDQWAGKGQRGKTWASTPGENLIMSAVLEPLTLSITDPFRLSMAVALSCHDLFSRYAGMEDCRIKWPNDLYWRDRKAGGILIENSFRGEQWLIAIAGIGMNINQVHFPETLRKAVSLRQITGREFRAADLARELAGCLQDRYEQLCGEIAAGDQGNPARQDGAKPPGTKAEAGIVPGPGGLLEAYNSLLYKQGASVPLKKDGQVFEATITGVSAAGELLTQTGAGERKFSFGEVEWVIGE